MLTGVTQLISVLFEDSFHFILQNTIVRYIALTFALSGVLIFIAAIITMRNSWRAGIDYSQKTELIKTGIYTFSRNPAFMTGFLPKQLGQHPTAPCRKAYSTVIQCSFPAVTPGMSPLNAAPVLSGNTYVQLTSRPLLQKNWGTEVYYPSEEAMKELLGDTEGTLVILGQ